MHRMSLIIFRQTNFGHLLNSSIHFSVPFNSQIICSAISATNLLIFTMDVDKTDSALEEVGGETDLDTDKEGKLLGLI